MMDIRVKDCTWSVSVLNKVFKLFPKLDSSQQKHETGPSDGTNFRYRICGKNSN